MERILCILGLHGGNAISLLFPPPTPTVVVGWGEEYRKEAREVLGRVHYAPIALQSNPGLGGGWGEGEL